MRVKKGDMNKLVIRVATRDDIHQIAKIGTYWLNNDECNQKFEDKLEALNNTFGTDHEIIVATIGKKIIGFFDIRVYVDWIIPRKNVHIEHMFLIREYIGKGIGTMILKYVINKYSSHQGTAYVFYYTEGGEEIRNFLKRQGFKGRGTTYFKKLGGI